LAEIKNVRKGIENGIPFRMLTAPFLVLLPALQPAQPPIARARGDIGYFPHAIHFLKRPLDFVRLAEEGEAGSHVG
jgi:hypothetical protein